MFFFFHIKWYKNFNYRVWILFENKNGEVLTFGRWNLQVKWRIRKQNTISNILIFFFFFSVRFRLWNRKYKTTRKCSKIGTNRSKIVWRVYRGWVTQYRRAAAVLPTSGLHNNLALPIVSEVQCAHCIL